MRSYSCNSPFHERRAVVRELIASLMRSSDYSLVSHYASSPNLATISQRRLNCWGSGFCSQMAVMRPCLGLNYQLRKQ
jgi:hypothetical protein